METSENVTSIKAFLWPVMERIENRSQGVAAGKEIISSFGFRDLDDLTAGLNAGDFVVVGGAAGMGKSAFVSNIATNVALGRKESVGFVSLEQPPIAYAERMVASEAQVSLMRVRSGRLRDEDFPRLGVAAGLLNSSSISFLHDPRMSLEVLYTGVSGLKAEGKLDLLIVDSLNLLSPGKLVPADANREQELSTVARELKAMALEFEIPVVATVNLSRAPGLRNERRPVLSDIRDSGDIENTADMVLFIYRPEYYFGPVDGRGKPLEGVAEIIVEKHRSGWTGTVSLWFFKEYGRFLQATTE